MKSGALAAGIVLALSQAGWSGTTAGTAGPLVAVIAARTGDTPIRFKARGHLVAINQVALRPQRDAIVSQVHFREGDTVRAGQLLFTLDERAAHNRSARTRICAPIAGTAGALTVHAGSLARPAAGAPLVSLIQLDPILVAFSLPAQDLAAILAARAGATLEVVLELPDGATVEGKLESIDQSAVAGGGAAGFKAVFPNPKRELWPASFANVRLVAGRMRDTAVLPPLRF